VVKQEAEKVKPVRICVDVSREDHEIVKRYNEGRIQPLMLTRVSSFAIAKEIARIKKEMENSDKTI
jgi:hypothetical protein